jgi:hypothetical protein
VSASGSTRQHKYQCSRRPGKAAAGAIVRTGFGGIQAKTAAAVTLFGVVAGTIGLIADYPDAAKMIAPG